MDQLKRVGMCSGSSNNVLLKTGVASSCTLINSSYHLKQPVSC